MGVVCINVCWVCMADCWYIKELPEEEETTNVHGIGFGGLL